MNPHRKPVELTLAIVATVLLIVWPVNGTTGLKNALLLLGSASACTLWARGQYKLQAGQAWRLAPLLLFFGWVVVQALCISPYPEVAVHQIGSVWVEAMLAAFMGATLGLLCRDDPYVRGITLRGLQVFPFAYLLNYAFASWQNGGPRIPINFELGFYGDKIKVVFFGLIALATAMHQIAAHFHEAQHARRAAPPWYSIACVFLAFLSFILVGSKSGMLQGALLFVIALFLLLRRRRTGHTLLVFGAAGVFIVAAGSWQLQHDQGWSNFSRSVRAGLDLAQYSNWKNYPASGLPVVDGGYQTQESAYLRAAGFRLGLQCLRSEPLGSGHLAEPLRYTRTNCALARETTIFTTLSALFDFTLIVGIPGVALFLLYFLAVMARRSASPGAFALHKIVPFGMLLTWTLSEVTETHYYESTLFLLSLLAFGVFEQRGDDKWN